MYLLITGPMVSKGQSGRTHGTSSEIVEYDCNENIQRVLTEFGALFDGVVLSTWSGARVSDEIRAAVTVVETDPAASRTIGIEATAIRPQATNNVFRQYLTCANAIANVPDDFDGSVVRMRTDMFVDLARLSRWCGQSDPDRVYAPGLRVTYPPGLVDFYFFGRRRLLETFFRAVVGDKQQQYFAWPHHEPVFKFAEVQCPNAVARILGESPKHLRGVSREKFWLTSRQLRLVHYMFAEHFGAMPFEVFEKALLRGQPLNETLVNHHLATCAFAEAPSGARRFPEDFASSIRDTIVADLVMMLAGPADFSDQ